VTKFLTKDLLKSASSVLSSFEDVDAADRMLILKIVRAIPIPMKLGDSGPTGLISETTDLDAALATMHLKYASRYDDMSSLLDESKASVATEEIEARDKVSRSTPEHIIKARLSFNPEYMRLKERVNRLKRFTEFLDALKWMAVRRTEVTQEIYRKEM